MRQDLLGTVNNSEVMFAARFPARLASRPVAATERR